MKNLIFGALLLLFPSVALAQYTPLPSLPSGTAQRQAIDQRFSGVVSITPSNGCAGNVTLSGGAGKFSQNCVTSSVICSYRDSTTIANAATPSAQPSSGRSFGDGSFTASSSTMTSASGASFVAGDVGRLVTNPNVPANTTITVVGSGTSVTMSQNATATASAQTVTLGGLQAITGTGTDVVRVGCW